MRFELKDNEVGRRFAHCDSNPVEQEKSTPGSIGKAVEGREMLPKGFT
jgi:hypothetical protein